MQRRKIGSLEELADRDLFTPKLRFLKSLMQVCGIEALVVLQLFHALLEPGIGIVVVVRHARAEDVDERKALVLYRHLDELREVLLLAAEPARHERAPRG